MPTKEVEMNKPCAEALVPIDAEEAIVPIVSEESETAETEDIPRHIQVIRPSTGWQILNVRELWHYRDLLVTLGVRDIKLRYRQTALGAIWVILQPLLAAGIFSFVFGRVAKLPSDGVPYFIFAYAGLLAWNAFSSALTKSGGSLVANAQLVSKVYFPRLILPLSSIFSTLVDFGVALAMMAVLMVMNGIHPHPGILLMPVWLMIVLTIALGLGLYASALMVTYRDVGYVVPVLTQFLMYASPVAYSVSAVPGKMRFVYFMNPLSGVLEAFRWSMLGTGHIQWGYVAWSATFAVLVFIFGAFSFRRMERKFADVI